MESQANIEIVNRLYKYMKNGMSIEAFAQKFNLSTQEVFGLVELCNLYGKQISVSYENDTVVFKRFNPKISVANKPSVDSPKLNHIQVLVVSDTHAGNIHQQFHLLNEVYEEAYYRGINTVFHVGDMVDGNYPNRPESPRQQFLHGFDEQAGYVVDMYPEIEGMTTYYILGSHDETHYKNDQATVNYWLSKYRKDMVYLGQDVGEFMLDKVKIVLDHPGGGSSQYYSYKPQKRIEILEPRLKPKVLLIGHFHKSYAFTDRNVHCILVPALCDKTQFQQKQGLLNAMGAYFLDIYYDQEGNIQYFCPEEIVFGKKDVWDEAGKDKKKVRKLEIKNSIY